MKKRLIAGLAAGCLLLAACGDDSTTADPPADDATEPADDTTDPAEPAGGDTAATVATGATDLGDVLVDGGDLTLYGFTNDIDGVPSCDDACADAWPPVLVDGDFSLGDGLSDATFSTAERSDGTTQLVAGVWPLYGFAGDAAPGDVNGQGSGDVWFAVAPDGSLIGHDMDEMGEMDEMDETDETDGSAAAIVTTADSSAGSILVDEAGLSLYGFTNDVDGVPSCFDACAEAWPPVLVDGNELPAGLDGAVFSVVDRGDGTWQLSVGAWPLYRFAADGAPGDINGQRFGDVWFLAAPDGSLVKDASVDGDTEEAGGTGYEY